MKLLAVAVLAASLTACSSLEFPYRQPIKTYAGDVKLANTAVFASADQTPGTRIGGAIIAVNGQTISRHFNHGHPPWVRVLPGSNAFKLHVRADFSGVPGVTSTSWKETELTVEVKDMKPGHVYSALYQRDLASNTVRVVVRDWGERGDFRLIFPWGVKNPEYIPAEF